MLPPPALARGVLAIGGAWPKTALRAFCFAQEFACSRLVGNIEQNIAQRLIGAAIRRFRERDDLTQEQLAAKAGISYQYLCGIETGKENFTIRVLEQVARALGLTPATLVAVAYGEESSVGFARTLRLGVEPA